MTSPEEARTAMVERLRAAGILQTTAVEHAMAVVPRHEFIEDVSIGLAYGPTAVLVKRADDGTPISSASQPEMVAEMLELGAIEPGHRVLEIGTATGYNAALLATLVGPDGLVVSIELEHDLAETAAARLRRLGFADVVVLAGDGAVGHPAAAPYDLIIATAGAQELPDAWAEQLRDGGRLVVPIVDESGRGDVRCLVKRGQTLHETDRIPCAFLPLREE